MAKRKGYAVNRMPVMSPPPKQWVVSVMDWETLDFVVQTDLLTEQDAIKAEKYLKKIFGL